MYVKIPYLHVGFEQHNISIASWNVIYKLAAKSFTALISYPIKLYFAHSPKP